MNIDELKELVEKLKEYKENLSNLIDIHNSKYYTCYLLPFDNDERREVLKHFTNFVPDYLVENCFVLCYYKWIFEKEVNKDIIKTDNYHQGTIYELGVTLDGKQTVAYFIPAIKDGEYLKQYFNRKKFLDAVK